MALTKDDQTQRIERYILNKMSDHEATEFEIDYLADQDCLEQLDIAKKLYDGLNVLDGENKLVPLTDEKPAVKESVWWQRHVPAWSLAATILIMLIPFGVLKQTVNNPIESYVPVAMVNIELSDVRGQESTKYASVEPNRQMIISTYIDRERIDLLYPEYGLTLINQQNQQTVVNLSGIRLNQDDMLYFNLGQGSVSSGRYQYEITATKAEGGTITLKAGQLVINNQQ